MKQLTSFQILLATMLVSMMLTSCSNSTAPASAPAASSDTATTEPASDTQAPAEPVTVNSNWIIEVNDTEVFNVYSTKLNMAMKMTATKSGGDIGGEYQATAKTMMDTRTVISEGWAESDSAGASDPFVFTVKPAVPLAPLVPKDNLEPAALVPDPDWEADGEITMAVSGGIDVHADGGTASGGLANKSSLPFHMTITGEKVIVTIDFPDVGTGNFHGTIRKN